MIKKSLKLSLALILLFVTAWSFSPDTAEAASSQFVTKANTSEKVVALTFDDGADGTNVNTILDTLSEKNVTATFFITGSGLEHHPTSIKRMTELGHQIGNHSYSHPDFTTLSATQMKNELDKTEALAKSVTGKSTKPIFRAPYGAYNNDVLSGVGAAGYTHTIQWNIDTVDWMGVSKTEIVNKVVNNITPGSIVLMHTGAGATGTPAAVPEIIDQLKAKGYTFVTVSRLLNLDPVPVFTDYDDRQFGYESVIRLYESGIIQGHRDGSFRPLEPISRLQAALTLVRYLDLDLLPVEESPFTDIPPHYEYASHTQAAYHEGIFIGNTSGAFQPDRSLTRAEAAAVLVRTFDLSNHGDHTFADAEGHFFEEEIAILYGEGITKGRTATQYDPDAAISRVEFAVMLDRTINN